MPKAQDALYRLIANVRLVKGNISITEVIERIRVVVRLVNQHIVAWVQGISKRQSRTRGHVTPLWHNGQILL